MASSPYFTGILKGVGAPITPANLTALQAWHQAEGGSASNNPFNTTQPLAGATPYNSVGVRNYPTPEAGIQATVQTLTNGRYGNILGALKQGSDPVAVAKAIAQSPWGTGAGVLRVLGQPGVSTPPAARRSPTAPLAQPQFTSPLQNPVVQQVIASNDKLLGIAPPPFPQAQTPGSNTQAPKRMTTGATGQLTYQIQGHVTERTRSAITLAEDYLGTPYVWGGDKPGGFDCSGLLQYVWARAGVTIPRTTYDQFKVGTPVSKAQLQPGDAVFFTGSDPQNGLPGHVGMYLGGGKVIEAPHTGADVQISNLSDHKDFVGGRRYA